VLEECSRRDWEPKKKRVFEELGGRVAGENRAISDLKKTFHGKSSLAVHIFSLSPCLLLNGT
jgi:nuclear pore complex protein Nup93